MKIALYRASYRNPTELASENMYSSQLPLYKLAEQHKPRFAPSRMGLFAGLTPREAAQWGDKLWRLETDIPHQFSNAYSVNRWTDTVDYWLANAGKNSFDLRELESKISQYWNSQKPIKEIIDPCSVVEGRWEVLLDPEWITYYEEYDHYRNPESILSMNHA